jgi:hypothetical protein
MALHDDVCWMQLNGWGGTADSPEELAEECRRLRLAAHEDLSARLGMRSTPPPGCQVHGPVKP